MDTATATTRDVLEVEPSPNRRVWFLGMVAILEGIVRGGTRLLRQLSPLRPTDVTDEARQVMLRLFKTDHLALIVARLQRGLALARAFEDHLLGRVVAIDAARAARGQHDDGGPRISRTPDAKPRAPRAKAELPAWDDDTLLERLPTAREIATWLRLRPPEEVMLDICRDLGFGPDIRGWEQMLIVIGAPPRVKAARDRAERKNSERPVIDGAVAAEGPVPDARTRGVGPPD